MTVVVPFAKRRLKPENACYPHGRPWQQEFLFNQCLPNWLESSISLAMIANNRRTHEPGIFWEYNVSTALPSTRSLIPSCFREMKPMNSWKPKPPPVHRKGDGRIDVCPRSYRNQCLSTHSRKRLFSFYESIGLGNTFCYAYKIQSLTSVFVSLVIHFCVPISFVEWFPFHDDQASNLFPIVTK